MHDAGMNLQEYAVGDPALLSRNEFHWVIAFEAKMNVAVEISSSINQPTPLVTAWGRNLYAASLQLSQRVEAAHVTDQL